MATKKKPDEEPEVVEEIDGPEVEKFDLVGADGRKILRNVSRNWADDERSRIQAGTGEELEVVPASPLTYLQP